MQINVKQLSINYEVFGEGKTLLFLHGWGAPYEIYRGFLNQVAKSSRIIALDLPGFGRSQEPETAWNVSEYADFIVEFLQTIGETPAHMMCHSFGGRIAIKLLGEKQALDIEKLILMDAAGVRSPKTLKQKLSEKSYKLMRKIYEIDLVQKMYPDALDELRAKRGSADYNNASEVMKRVLVQAVNEDQRGFLGGIKADTLLVWGEKDTATSMDQARVMEERIARAKLVVYKDAGHFSFIEHKEEAVEEIRQFLE